MILALFISAVTFTSISTMSFTEVKTESTTKVAAAETKVGDARDSAAAKLTKIEVTTGFGVVVDTESFEWTYFWKECENKIVEKMVDFYKIDYTTARDYHGKKNYRAFLVAMCKLSADDDLKVRGSTKLGDQHLFICHQRGATKWLGKLDLVAGLKQKAAASKLAKAAASTSTSTSYKVSVSVPKSTKLADENDVALKLLAESTTTNKGGRAGPVSLNYKDHEEVISDFVRLNGNIDGLINNQKRALKEDEEEGWKRDRLDCLFDTISFGWKATWQMHSFVHSAK